MKHFEFAILDFYTNSNKESIATLRSEDGDRQIAFDTMIELMNILGQEGWEIKHVYGDPNVRIPLHVWLQREVGQKPMTGLQG